jgi:prolyl-tRNA editing enzyme YbaK/EbsC (Cys-tRNA(Pro) deacylase)
VREIARGRLRAGPMLDLPPCPTRSIQRRAPTPARPIRPFGAWSKRPPGAACGSRSKTTHTAEDAARALGVEGAQIVKSLVFVVPGADGALEPVICLVSGPNRVDVGLLSVVMGEVGIRRATAREARELTGFSIGGIPPVGCPRPVRVVMDPDLCPYPEVWAAAGRDRCVFPITPAALETLTDAIVAPIAETRADGA